MASIQTSISKRGGDVAQVKLRFVATQTIKPKFSTGIAVPRAYWSDAKGELKTNGMNADQADKNNDTNKLLSNLKAHLKSRYIENGQGYTTAEDLRKFLELECDKFLHPENYEPQEDKPKTLMEIVGDVVTLVSEKGEIDGGTLTASTIITYKQCQSHLNAYLKYKRVTDYETSDLTSAWYDDFTAWLYDKQGLKRNSVGKQVKVLKSILRKRIPMAQRGSCEFIVPRKCQVVRDKASDINAVFLNEEQLKVIAEQTLSPKLAAQRDLFLLQCWTGQRYSDLGKLVAENIRTTKKGNHRYFSIVQQKTGEPVAVPILPEAEAILAKYGDAMPKPWSNQKYNDAISDICHIIANTAKGREAGFNDEVEHRHNNCRLVTKERFYDAVTSHTARRSFCTNCYRRRMPIALIMSVSGHQSEKVFFDYIREPLSEGRKRMVEDFFNESEKH